MMQGEVVKLMRVSSHASLRPKMSKPMSTWNEAPSSGSAGTGRTAWWGAAGGVGGSHGTTARWSAILCAAAARRCCAAQSARCHCSQPPGSCILDRCVRHWRWASEANLLQSRQKRSPSLLPHHSSAPAQSPDDPAGRGGGSALAAAASAARSVHAWTAAGQLPHSLPRVRSPRGPLPSSPGPSRAWT